MAGSFSVCKALHSSLIIIRKLHFNDNDYKGPSPRGFKNGKILFFGLLFEKKTLYF